MSKDVKWSSQECENILVFCADTAGNQNKGLRVIARNGILFYM